MSNDLLKYTKGSNTKLHNCFTVFTCLLDVIFVKYDGFDTKSTKKSST